MTIQFKDKALEARLQAKTNEILSASQVACRDLWRYEWLLENQETIMLTEPEYYAFCSTIKAMPHLLQPSQIRRLALLVEDAMKSSRDNSTGKPTKETLWKGLSVDDLCQKLYKASPIQLFALLERAEKVSEEEITRALLAQRQARPTRTRN
jgi:hypothetical protein